MMKLLGESFLWLWLLSGLVACRVEYGTPVGEVDSGNDTAPAETEVASVVTETEVEATTPDATFTVTLTPNPSATNTQVPTASATPTLTPRPTRTFTPTPTSLPEVKVRENLEQNINVRAGPSTDTSTIGSLAPGEVVTVTGRNGDGSWWQILFEDEVEGWVFSNLVVLERDNSGIPVVEGEEVPTPAPTAIAQTDGLTPTITATFTPTPPPVVREEVNPSAAELAEQLKCGKDFCVTFQSMVPIWENGGCIGNHSIYITVLQGLPPGEPMDNVVVGDTFGNVEVGSGSHGPGRTEITLWNNSMTLIVKRHQDGTEYTSEESFNFTAADELIPAEVLAANGYCEGRVDTCEIARNNNQVCRGHYSWRVTFHKLE